ncbi:MAG: hypothetical protein ACLRFL_02560 [Clostridia bacterium]
MRITESNMVDFIFGTTKFNKTIYKNDMEVERNYIQLSKNKCFELGYTIKIKDVQDLYIFNFSELTCELKVISDKKLIATHDLSDIWSIYHMRHAVKIDSLIDLLNAGISELETIYMLSKDEIELIKTEIELNKMRELLEILNDRKYNGGKNLLAKLSKKFIKPKTETKDNNPNTKDNNNPVSNNSSEKPLESKFDWDKKDFGM